VYARGRERERVRRGVDVPNVCIFPEAVIPQSNKKVYLKY